MLQIQNVSKQYKTGDLVQQALDDVSLSLRDSEFVSILGPSGSGKTTLLNIIGGLDRYDEGDLVINGVSTKHYSDRDWDSYRNHSVGFVFQSYNLIPHQTILSNVELALTISGISSKERRERATEALSEVGLGDQIHKKPSQLSGGQMQRVAIARALVNDPDILLADEPTGALDSETSVHIMDLLKEVAGDRLVVMVTHNPELAQEYSTRIVELKDGRIISDTDPYEPKKETSAVHRNMGRSSMSYLTALLLSFNNLWTKKARTILVSVAGSIGIIGIAMILSMSTGADTYIKNIEEESLQSYPLTINDTSINLESMYLTSMGSAMDSVTNGADVTELKTVTGFLSNVKPNDLKSLKAFFESDECDIDNYVQAIEYSYAVTPQIYTVGDDDSFRRVNPDTSFSSLGFSGSEGASNSLISAFSSTDSFYAMPENEKLYVSSYDVKAGRWPKDYHECVVVVTENGSIADLTLFALGLKDPKKLDEMVKNFSEGKSTEDNSGAATFSYEDFLGISFKLLNSCDYYTYDKEYKVWADRSSDDKYIKTLLKDAEDITVVGVVAPVDGSSASALEYGINYPASLTRHMIEAAQKSGVVKAQKENPEVDVISGKKFSEMKDDKDFDMSSLFSVDADALSKMFDFDLDSSDFDLSSIDLSSLDFSSMDLSGAISLDQLASAMPSLSEKDLKEIFSKVKINISEEKLEEVFSQLLDGFSKYAQKNPSSDYTKFLDAIASFISSDEAAAVIERDITAILSENTKDLFSEEELTQIVTDIMAGYSAYLEAAGAEESTPELLARYLNSPEVQAIISSGVAALNEKIAKIVPTDAQLKALTDDLLSAYQSYAEAHTLPTVSSLLKSFTEYLSTDEAQKLITDTVSDIIDTKELESVFSEYMTKFSSAFSGVMSSVMNSVADSISEAMVSYMSTLGSSLSNSLTNAFDFSSDSFSKLFSAGMDMNEMSNLLLSMLSKEEKSYENNLKKFGYAELSKPSTITIFPTDFNGKKAVKDIIERYNKTAEKNGEDDKVISYTDMVDTLMSSVTDIVDAISYVLIAFVAISLVVSSIMIGVITYISVLERRKEIGILRALGASKRNISQVFNAETFIIGALAGLFGVGFTYLLIIPTNAILHALLPQQNVTAILPAGAAAILVLLSIVLTLIGGFIPSKKAAKKDPVIALRTE